MFNWINEFVVLVGTWLMYNVQLNSVYIVESTLINLLYMYKYIMLSRQCMNLSYMNTHVLYILYREGYMKELAVHVQVHTYGNCGVPCPGNSTSECLQYLSK